MRIGLVGEAPSDTMAIENLLSRYYKDLEFITLLNGLTGSMLDSKTYMAAFLSIEFHQKIPDIVIFVRDLDSHEKDKEKIEKRRKIFAFVNQRINGKGILLLNIYELEALIFADISKFNKLYGSQIKPVDDPMKIADPKGKLINATRKSSKQFEVSHNPEIFKLLNFDLLKSNCRYFATFIEKFNEKLADL